MINYQSKSLGLKDSSLTKTEANTQNSLNNINDFDSRLKDRHVVDIYIYIYIYIQWAPLNRITVKGIFWLMEYNLQVQNHLYICTVVKELLKGIPLKGIFWI